MSQIASEHDIKRTLEMLFDFIIKLGISIDSKKQQEMISEIVDAFKNTRLSQQDLKDKQTQAKLMHCITSLVLGKKEPLNDTATLFDEGKAREPMLEIDQKLKTNCFLIKALTTLLGTENKKQLTKVTPELKKNLRTEKSAASSKHLEEQLDATLRNLYGGDNPTINGEIQFPVLGPIVGNLLGHTNQCSADPKSVAFMVQSITYNSDKPDPLGLEKMNSSLDQHDGVSVQFSPSFTRR